MATTNKAGYELAGTDLFVTYGTGGIKSPASHEVLSLAEFHQRLLTEHRAETQALNELWHPYTRDTPRTRQLQHQLIEKTFPFVVAGALYDADADAADDEDDWSGWQTPSGLVVLSFTYPVAKDNEVVTLHNRLRLQSQLQYVPLLGPSMVEILNAPGECTLHALVAADPVKDYWQQVRLMTRYFQVIHTKRKLDGQLLGGDLTPTYPHSVGYDPHAYLRPRPAKGHSVFPSQEALAKIAACEQPNKFCKGA